MRILGQVSLATALTVPFLAMMSAQTARLEISNCEIWVGKRTCTSVTASRKNRDFDTTWADSGTYYYVARKDAIASEEIEDFVEDLLTATFETRFAVLGKK